MVTMAEKPRARPYQELARRVVEARASARLSQPELARLAGVSTGYIGSIEVGSRRPSPEILRAIARVVGIAPEVLLASAGYSEPVVGEITIGVEPSKAPILRRLAELPLDWLNSFEHLVARIHLEQVDPNEQRKDGNDRVSDGDPPDEDSGVRR